MFILGVAVRERDGGWGGCRGVGGGELFYFR